MVDEIRKEIRKIMRAIERGSIDKEKGLQTIRELQAEIHQLIGI